MNASVQAPADNEPKLSKADPPPHANSGPQETAATCERRAIRDRQFIQEIRKLQLMRSIQRGEGVAPPEDISKLWPLLQLHYAPWPWGRLPSEDEWKKVDKLSVELLSEKNDNRRKKYLSSQVPMLITWLPLAMLFVAGVTLGLSVYAAAGTHSVTLAEIFRWLKGMIPWYHSSDPAPDYDQWLKAIMIPWYPSGNPAPDYDQFVVAYLIWSVCMGVIGAAASVGMTAISVLTDATLDISSRHQIWLRVTLGGVFALVLALPFGLANFTLFCYYAGHLIAGNANLTTSLLANVSPTPPSLDYEASKTSSMMYAFALLAPFLFGYSTSLVTNFLSRLINGLQEFPKLPAPPEGQLEKRTQSV